MNKIIKAFVVVFAITLSFVSNSCDKFDTFEFNVPFSIDVTVQGNNSSVSDSTIYCLNQSETYQDYVEDMRQLTFVEAAWRTDAVQYISSGDIEITVSINGGATLFQKTLTNVNPSSYQSPNGPFVLSLTDTEIQALNTYLNSYLENPNQCIKAKVKATVKSPLPVTQTVYLKGIIDMVVEAETEI